MSWLLQGFAVLASYRLAFVCLAGLFVTTWLGTLYQVDHGLWAAQWAYFESWLLWQRLGDLFVGSGMPAWLDDSRLALPLPGGMLWMSLLGVSLVCGGFVRLLRSMRGGARLIPRAGVLVVHCGIALLLMAGWVRFAQASEGSITLTEGQTARSYASFHDWELVVARQVGDGEVEEHLIPGARFLDLEDGEQAEFVSDLLPFRIVVVQAARNSDVRRHGGEFLLRRKLPLAENERNMAGCVVALRDASGGELRGVLCGTDTAPWTVGIGDERWALALRKETWPLPFALRLEDFTAEMHPGTTKPKAFRSDVTVRTAAGERRTRIEMNEPLRLGDVVVYQSTWGQQGGMPGAPLFSGFQVVRNPADQWPLYGCILIALGMLLAFGWTLVRFLTRETSRVRGAGALLLAGVFAAPLSTQAQEPRAQPWPAAALEHCARLPVQEDGRVKPLLTHVSYLLLRINGKRTVSLGADPRFGAAAGASLDPVAWALDVLLFPEQADLYPVFQVQTSEVIDAIGLEHDGKRKRDRYSFAELRPGLPQLLALAQRFERIAEKDRSGIEQQLVMLARNIADYDRLARSLDAARLRFQPEGDATLLALLGGRSELRFSELLPHWPALQTAREQSAGAKRWIAQAQGIGRDDGLLHVLPPPDPAQAAWLLPADLVREHAPPVAEPVLALLALFEELVDARQQPARFAAVAGRLDEALHAQLRARGEGAKLDLEVSYLQADWCWRALLAFGLALVVTAVSWLRPRSRLLGGAAWLATLLGAGLLVTGIVIRCILRDRPPISGLYETILFVTAAIVLTGLVVERFWRRRVLLSLAALLGFAGMFLAGRFEASEARDTMPTLQAVLDTNFWLATHVTVINLGYAGALLAGFLAHLYLLRGRRRDPAFSAAIARATYGTLCFATLFTTVGTILGGIWANDSWGRFWGWDPKENGALMIVLWNLMILHGRLGGIVREHGIAMLAVAGNVVVVFSWFHTNLLGVGLHSYGFASGLSLAVWTFYALEVGVLVAAQILHVRARALASVDPAAAAG